MKHEMIKQEPVVKQEANSYNFDVVKEEGGHSDLLLQENNFQKANSPSENLGIVQEKASLESTTQFSAPPCVSLLFQNLKNNHGESRQHLEDNLPENRPLNICPKCNLKLKSDYCLRMHMKFIHSDERPFSCHLCNYTCKRKFCIRKHLKNVHTADRPFGCTECANTFKTKHNLQRHMKTHSAERPFGCSKCTSSFKHKSHLTTHLKKVHANYKEDQSDFSGS